jgi:ATP-dependent Lon protease
MTEKKNKSTKHPIEVVLLVNKKMSFFQDVIQRTILHVHKNKMYDILGISDVSTCINILNDLSDKIKDFIKTMESVSTDTLINNLQTINNDLSTILKNYGTELLDDLLSICFGSNNAYYQQNNETDINKFDLLRKYFHPTGYKVANIKKSENNDSQEDSSITEKSKNLDCYDISLSVKQFHNKVYGIKIFFYNSSFKKNLMIYGILDDVIIDFLNNDYLSHKMFLIKENIPKDPEFHNETFDCFLSALTLKDYLIFNHTEIFSKYVGFLSNVNALKQRALSVMIRDFTQSDLYSKRSTLIQLLIKSCKNYDNQYLAYLLYDLLSNDANGNVDTQEQTILFDSFPWSIKKFFRDAMKRTIQYTNDLTNFDMNKIPLEQQICLLKANDNVKEKAMMKLKEVKAKSEDSGSKARQYLDGLLKIPFSIYKREPVLDNMIEIRNIFNEVVKNKEIKNKMELIDNVKDNYTSIEIIKYLNKYNSLPNLINIFGDVSKIKKELTSGDKNVIIANVIKINELIKQEKLKVSKLSHSNKNKSEIKKEIELFVETHFDKNPEIFKKLLNTGSENLSSEDKNIKKLNSHLLNIKNYISDVKVTLDKAVHGHDNAKKQIERIIGQWINGEQDGYCFGFEGPPGVGKTSLAKRGLADCLKDEEGKSRPFAMIQMGGDSNGSSLHGHNYTYVGSTWGSIVQILIDKKCMNPIIFIDELDKISKTEHGKEIIGILTHLLDPTQNDCFQDKYFTGIDLDLSKALFILSYNDVEVIDKVLLDRIHRIKFSNLSLEDKLIIANTHILPEVYKKMGLKGIIKIDDDVLKLIIEEYTSEPGVRKLKEILFELVGDINLVVLKETSYEGELPIHISREDIKNKYLKSKHEIKHKKIHANNKIGQINGMWANAMGQGGIIPIQVKHYPADDFLKLKLTGMQGDVMKESMNVALTLAWDLTEKKRKEEIKAEHFSILSGVHIHCPEGSVPKDGPSAGTAITTSIYSLFNNKKIRHDVAITGEISLDGIVTEIGGLDLKILGGIKAGVKEFIYPTENKKDFDSFMEKYKDSDLILDIKFYPVTTIEEVFEIIFEK